MIGRYFFLFLGAVFLIWIFYAGSDLVDKKSEFSPAYIFGEEDGKVLVVNQLKECSLDQLKFHPLDETRVIFEKIGSVKIENKQYFISELQNHLLIKNKEDWTKEKVMSYFHKMNLKVVFNSRHSFTVAGYEGKFNVSSLYLYKTDVHKPKLANEKWLDFDLKSSASMITFKKKRFTITDIYVQSSNQIQYVTKNANRIKGNQIDDENLFSQVLSDDVLNYHFYEKEYLSSIDQTFKNSPLFYWMDKGVVEFQYDGHFVLVSDFIAGQEPLLILDEMVTKSKAIKTEVEGQFQNIRLTSTFPENISRGFYVKMMDDYMVASTSLAVCEQVVADYKLGNTLAMKKDKLSTFHQLPKKVSERFISTDKAYARSIYNGKFLETRLRSNPINVKQPETSDLKMEEKSSETISMFAGESVQSFVVFNEKGNVAALTKDGELSYFSGGRNSWKKEFKDEVIGEIQLIDFASSGEKNLLCTTKHAIHLVDKSGNEIEGFPIKVDVPISNEVLFYQWNRNSYFAFSNEKNELIIIDSKSKKVTNLKTGLSSVNQKVDVWLSNKILLAGIKDDRQCVLFNIDKRKEHRRYAIEDNSVSLKKENELVTYAMKNNQFLAIDQKGNRKNISIFPNGKIEKVITNKNSNKTIIRSKNEVIVLNEEQIYARIALPFTELDDVNIFNGPNGNSYITVIDGLSNNVSIYKSNGDLVNKVPFEGKKQCFLHWNSNQMILSTIVDGYIVQYLCEN